jgi:hypothetical protein
MADSNLFDAVDRPIAQINNTNKAQYYNCPICFALNMGEPDM